MPAPLQPQPPQQQAPPVFPPPELAGLFHPVPNLPACLLLYGLLSGGTGQGERYLVSGHFNTQLSLQPTFRWDDASLQYVKANLDLQVCLQQGTRSPGPATLNRSTSSGALNTQPGDTQP